MLAIVHKNVPDRNNFISTIKNEVTIVDEFALRNKTTYDNLLLETYSRVALIWENNDSEDKIPMVVRVKRQKTVPKDRSKPYINNNLFSTDLQNLLTTLQTNNGGSLTVDLITCNLNSEVFISYINKFMTDTGIVVNYSIDTSYTIILIFFT